MFLVNNVSQQTNNKKSAQVQNIEVTQILTQFWAFQKTRVIPGGPKKMGVKKKKNMEKNETNPVGKGTV